MKEKLFTAVYNDDIPQFEMHCYCLNKNWKGNPHLTVVVGKPNPKTAHLPGDINTIRDIIKQQFDSRWTVEVIDGTIGAIHGYQEQMINKIKHSIDSRFFDVIVFDAKDFLLKPCDISSFKYDDGYKVFYTHSDKTYSEFYTTVDRVVENISDDTPISFFTTPWCWNQPQLIKFWTYLESKFGTHESWTGFPGATEWSAFFAYTWNDSDSAMNLIVDEYEKVNFGGVWQNLSYENVLQQAKDFHRWDDMIVWKHTRKVLDPKFVVLTSLVLQEHGIPADLIAQWAKHYIERIPFIDVTN